MARKFQKILSTLKDKLGSAQVYETEGVGPVGNLKEVEGDRENETQEESEQSETKDNDASSSEADDLEEMDYDPKDDKGFDDDEHIL
nr:hypothetical protein [Tanacetum cinerariifolium]